MGRFRSLLRAAVDCAFAYSGHRGPDVVLDSALSILLTPDNSISVRFSKNAIHIKLPRAVLLIF